MLLVEDNMKKIFRTLVIALMLLSLTGCKDSASMAVEKYLAKYNSLDNEVLADMQNIIDKENLSDENKALYQSIFEKQYTDLTYEIVEEEYDGDEATVDAKITVYDLYKVQNDATNYLANHPEEFNEEKGLYDVIKFMAYKLNEMKMVTETVEYTIEFYVVKTSDGWTVSSLSTSDLEKIHGIYDYES